MKTRKVQTDIKTYCDGISDIYPKYDKYLSLNNKISSYLLEIYYNKSIPKDINYNTYFDDFSSIELASEILESLSTDLKNRFLNYIENNDIYLSNNEMSATFIHETHVRSSVKRNNNIVDAISLIHEFMHYIHLEKYDDISYEDYYYFTEILGIFGDLYSIFYLINNKPELKCDVDSYLTETISSIAACADNTLPFGIIIEIYRKKHSLSKFALMKYIKENDISKKFMHVLDFYKDVEHFSYHEDVRYVFAFPIAFKISKALIEKNYKIYEYKEVFDKLPVTSPEKCLHMLNLDTFFENDEELEKVMNEMFETFINIYTKKDYKIKKYGEL